MFWKAISGAAGEALDCQIFLHNIGRSDLRSQMEPLFQPRFLSDALGRAGHRASSGAWVSGDAIPDSAWYEDPGSQLAPSGDDLAK